MTLCTPRRVAIVDHDPGVHEACALALGAAGWERVSFRAAREAVAAARRGDLPGTVLMEMSLPGEHAARAIAEIRAAMPEAAIVALTAHQDDELIFAALRAGAVGYVLKPGAIAELDDVLEVVVGGGSPLSPSVARRVLGLFAEASSRFEALSERETQILRRFAAGAGYAETAEELSMAVDTLRTHVRRMYAKLRVHSRAQAVLAAARRGLLG